MIMAEPCKSGFDLMLTRFGPVKLPLVDKAKPRIMPDMFRGEWNSKNRAITWTARDMPARLRGKATEKNSSEPKQTFEMVVAVDGKILIQSSKHTPQGQMATGKAIVRTAEAVAGPVTLTGEHSFQTADEVADSQIKPWLPRQATEITLRSERNGHYARYELAEKDFMRFLDDIREADKGKSAHKRGERSGGGTVAKPERIENRFKRAGWENQGKFTIHHGPSKRSSAVTTYYYDREAGIAYQDRGYW
ncbi:MAG: hypothetical protein P8J87_12385 [Verrucomicrobiales bacterium]|nr:hypothetical protein [Verrucomicrobiales bacterium]